jgi:hypothetical protein
MDRYDITTNNIVTVYTKWVYAKAVIADHLYREWVREGVKGSLDEALTQASDMMLEAQNTPYSYIMRDNITVKYGRC